MKPRVSSKYMKLLSVYIKWSLITACRANCSKALALFTTFNENAATYNTLDVKVRSEWEITLENTNKPEYSLKKLWLL